MLSTLAGCASNLFSDTSAAAVTCATMKPEIAAAFLDQEHRYPTHLRVDEQRDAPLGERGNLGHRERQLIGRERNGLGVKVASGSDRAVLRKHEWIVGHRIRFAHQRRRSAAHHIE